MGLVSMGRERRERKAKGSTCWQDAAQQVISQRGPSGPRSEYVRFLHLSGCFGHTPVFMGASNCEKS